jgi:hypothetical protein
VNGTQPGSLGAEVLAAASAALSATSMALAADNLFYDSSAKVRTLQAAGGTLFCLSAFLVLYLLNKLGDSVQQAACCHTAGHC